MRLDTRTPWLLAGLLGMAAESKAEGTAASSTTPAAATGTILSYDQSTFPTNTPVVFPFPGPDQSVQFKFSDSSASIVNVTLWKHQDNSEDIAVGSGEPTSQETAAGANGPLPASGSSTGAHASEAARRRKRVDILPSKDTANVDLPVDDASVTLTLQSKSDEWSAYNMVYLYLQFNWETSEFSGSSYTPVFGVAQSSNNPADSQYQQYVDFRNRLASEPGAGVSPYKSESRSSSAAASMPMPTGASSSGSSSTRASTNGLSTGAAAGIGVGVGIAGLLIIGLLLWMFFRYRRQHQDPNRHDPSSRAFTGASYRSDSGVMMPDKEAAGMGVGAVGAEASSPHSAYGDESARFAEQRSSIALNDTQQHGRGLNDDSSPYTDYAMGGASAPRGRQSSVGDRSTSARSPSPPITSRYAHLVEEGMTEDEIRRLEEEERHLDAAIEQADSRQGHRR